MRYHNLIRWIATSGPGSAELELQIDWEAEEAVVHLEVPAGVQAAPAIAHGGFLAALADHVMGFVAAKQEDRAAVTRQMTVDYLAPTPTSTAITIRARADSVSERVVAVSLEGSVDDSGLVTFTARGDYARVAPPRWHPGRAETDYDTLEERFDPSPVFGWLVSALKDAYVPGAMSTVRVLVEVADPGPGHWTFITGGTSLAVGPLPTLEWDVRFAGTVRAWRELMFRRKTPGELVAAGSATIEDPAGLLPSFLDHWPPAAL